MFIIYEEFVDFCRQVYFSPDDISDSTFIMVNAGLYHLFGEESFASSDPHLIEQYQNYQQQCHSNLEAALFRLPMFLPPTMHNVKALLIGVCDSGQFQPSARSPPMSRLCLMPG